MDRPVLQLLLSWVRVLTEEEIGSLRVLIPSKLDIGLWHKSNIVSILNVMGEVLTAVGD